MSARPRRLWVSLALQIVFAAVTGIAALVAVGAGLMAAASAGLFGALALGFFLVIATILAGLSFLSVGGIAGTLRGERRGFWLAIVAHALTGLALLGLGLDSYGNTVPPGSVDTEAWRLPLAGGALVLASAGVLLTPRSLRWYGVLPS